MAQAILTNGAAPSTPAAGLVTVYSKTDKTLAYKDDAGNETALVLAGGYPAIASAATIDIFAIAGAAVTISGTTTVTAITACAAAQVGSIKTFVPSNAAGFSITATANIVVDGATSGTYLMPQNANVQIIATSTTTFKITTIGKKGTTTNDAAVAGNVGEYVESIGANVSAPTSNQWGDIAAAISLTAGDWDISFTAYFGLNGATITRCAGGIGTVTGNDATNLVAGDTYGETLAPTAAAGTSVAVPPKRVSIAATTSYYPKMNITYSAGTPKVWGRISARRVR